MYKLAVAGALAFATLAFGADVTGSWKLNTTKSKYTNMAAPKDMMVVYAPAGSGWRYEGKGTSATGEAINANFTYVKDDAEIKTTGFPHWDGMVLKAGSAAKSTGTLMRQGKKVGTVTRTISADGKTMTVRGKLTAADGKAATYLAVYDKQ